MWKPKGNYQQPNSKGKHGKSPKKGENRAHNMVGNQDSLAESMANTLIASSLSKEGTSMTQGAFSRSGGVLKGIAAGGSPFGKVEEEKVDVTQSILAASVPEQGTLRTYILSA